MDDQARTQAGDEAIRDVEGSVRRAAVNEDHLEIAARLADDALKGRLELCRHIERWDNYRKGRCGHGGSHVSSVLAGPDFMSPILT